MAADRLSDPPQSQPGDYSDATLKNAQRLAGFRAAGESIADLDLR